MNDHTQHIRAIFIAKMSTNTYKYDIGLLYDDYTISILQLLSKSNNITYFSAKAMNHMFKSFNINYQTDICVLNNISKDDVLSIYLSILNLKVGCNIKFIDINMIPKRINAYHLTYLKKKASDITYYMIDKLWNKLVSLQKCPWITAEVDQTLKNTSSMNIRRQKLIRLGLYYIIIKRFLVDKTRKSAKKSLIT